MRKRITIFTTKSLTINRFLDQIIIDLNNKYELNVVCKDPNNLQINPMIITKKINFPDNFKDLINPLKIIICIWQIRKLCKITDCIYLHTPLASHLARLAVLSLVKRPKVIYHVHGLRYISGIWGIKSFIYRAIEFSLSFLTNCFICINETDYKSLLKYNNKSKIEKILGVGVHISLKENVVKSLDPRKPFVVGTIASYKKEKGYEQLIKVAGKFKKTDNLIFRTFGYGDKTWIIKQVQKEKLDNLFINDFSNDIENEIQKFNLFFLPSLREGLNVSIQECLARGVPVVTTKIRGCEDLIIDGINGYCYEPQNINKASNFIEKIMKLRNNDYKKLSENSYQYAKKNLNRKILSKKICETLRKYV